MPLASWEKPKIVRHIGEEGVLCDVRQLCGFESVFESLLLLDFPQHFFVDSAEAQNELVRRVLFSDVDDSQLQVNDFAVLDTAVVEVIGGFVLEHAAHIFERELFRHGGAVVRVNPLRDIVLDDFVIAPDAPILVELLLGAAAQAVGQNGVAFKIEVEDRVVVYAQSLDDFQAL